jgi:uncharacterized protein
LPVIYDISKKGKFPLAAILPLKQSKNYCTFDIHVTPRSSRAEITGIQDEALKIKVTALPVEGAANIACIRLLARELGLKKNQLEIFAGTKSRKKTVAVKDITTAELEKKISSVLRR